jgi:hypothetical protein
MIKPSYILAFLVSIFAVMLGIMTLFPNNEITISNNFSLKFPSINSFFSKKEIKHTDISEIVNIKVETPEDTILTNVVDTTITETPIDTAKAESEIQELEFSEKGKALLFNFFTKIKKSKKVSHILHYGDSQIEGDRITSYFRNKLQKYYGGTGNGLVQAYKLAESFSINQEILGEWHRYNIFGRRDSTVNHRSYGAMGTFCRFAPTNAYKTGNIYESSILFTRSKIAYRRDRYYNRIKLFYGNAKEPVLAEVIVDGKQTSFEKLETGTSVKVKTWYFKKSPKSLQIKFTGSDSPDIYGISFEGNNGLVVDNIPMRGASGTNFTSLNYSNFKSMFDKLNVKMVILEYGGNIVPFIKSSKGIKNYGRAFALQLKLFKKFNPTIPIIVIGPADMSKKVDGEFITYPILEPLIDEMKAVTLNEGYIFWNMYEAMGGENSMPEWVKHKPALAAGDYIHFTTRGAHIIAEKFYEAIIKVQNEYDYVLENNIEYDL